ncbi:MAG: tetratricopeptide repeat protein [Myxococcales bacterium]|nr:tetratricopeptide repeat protein [Myxococcales bacterium]
METTSPFVFEATTATFETTVLARSHEVPVLVDFWAPWCGPCRTLTPILEKIVLAQDGKVLLAKVNTDEEQELARQHRIASIPAVKAFYQGRVVSEFVGARDGRFIDNFLKQLIPQAGSREVEEAASQLAMGMPKEAAAQLTQLLGTELSGELKTRAQLLLAEAKLLSGDALPSEITQLLAEVDPRSLLSDRAEELAAVNAFFEVADEEGGPAAAAGRLAENERDSTARFIVAAGAARRGDFAAALENLLTLVSRDRRFRDDAARKAMTALFGLLGANSDLSHEYRRRLQVVC